MFAATATVVCSVSVCVYVCVFPAEGFMGLTGMKGEQNKTKKYIEKPRRRCIVFASSGRF